MYSTVALVPFNVTVLVPSMSIVKGDDALNFNVPDSAPDALEKTAAPLTLPGITVTIEVADKVPV